MGEKETYLIYKGKNLLLVYLQSWQSNKTTSSGGSSSIAGLVIAEVNIDSWVGFARPGFW